MQRMSGHQACAISLCFLVTAVSCDPFALKASSFEEVRAQNGTVSVNTSNYQKLVGLEAADEQSKATTLSESETQHHTGQMGATSLADSGIDSCHFRLGQEAPFYFIAIQGTIKLFISDWAFPVHGWRGPLTKGQFVFACGMNLLALSTSVRDTQQGFEYLKIAWMFISIVWPSLLAGIASLVLWLIVYALQTDKNDEVWAGRLGWLSCGFCVIVPLICLIFMNYRMSQWATLDSSFFKTVNCSSLIWSSSPQIISVVQSCAVLKQWLWEWSASETHWSRKVTLIPWVILNAIIYFPVLSLLFATHVIPAAIEFLPVTLVIAMLLVCYSKIVTYLHNEVKKRVFQKEQLLLTEAEQQKKSWAGWSSGMWKYYAHREDYEREKEQLQEISHDMTLNDLTFEIKAAAVPCALVVKFLGEIIVRHRLGSSWWSSVQETWSERTLGKYMTSLVHSAMSKVSFVQQIL